MKLKTFTNIGELLTLDGAHAKGARHVGEADLSIISDAVLVCHAGKVVWSGRKADFNESLLKPWGGANVAETVSLGGHTVLPAFVEPHTHLIFNGNRAHEFEWRINGQNYQEITTKGGGIRFTVNETRKASLETLLALAQKRADKFLRQGVTTLEVKTGYGLDVETELRCLEVAHKLKGPSIVTTYLGAHSKSPDFPDLDSYLKMMCDELLPRIAKGKLAERVDIYIEPGFFTKEHAKIYFRRARELGLDIVAHVEQLSDSGGAETALPFQPRSLDHLVFVQDSTIKKLAKAETTAVLLPASDFYLKMEYPKARKMIDEGVRVALSTDFNPGTSPTQDLSLVGVLARLEMKMSLPEVISAYTLGAAFALGRGLDVGSLSNGKHCDFNVLSGSWRDLFYAVGEHPIEQVFKSGELVYSSHF